MAPPPCVRQVREPREAQRDAVGAAVVGVVVVCVCVCEREREREQRQWSETDGISEASQSTAKPHAPAHTALTTGNRNPYRH